MLSPALKGTVVVPVEAQLWTKIYISGDQVGMLDNLPALMSPSGPPREDPVESPGVSNSGLHALGMRYAWVLTLNMCGG